MLPEPIHIPSEERCRRIMADLGMLENIVAHCLQVCRVSLLLTDHLSVPGLNRELIRAAALLHDITKTRSFHTKEDHSETGARLLADLGYQEVARIVGQHVRLDRYPLPSAAPTDAEIVNYSDKRVLHDKIVPLSERMGYILEKYGSSPERKRNILLLWEKTEKLEKRLFAGLPFAPGDVSGLLAVERSARDCQGLPHRL
ncbi:MAG: HDIG domain-containing protein [Deltaproteobacteria bacterium]|nr:HDIG domain-containing protein [Deltaproteobacteria bacterium]